MRSIGQRTDQLVVAPKMRRDAVIQLIRSANRELILSMFRCDDFQIVDELAAAVRRGIHVRVLITQRARGWKEKLKDLTALLRSLGAEVLPYKQEIVKYHAKYVVADDGPALVTSLNFTHKCFDDTCDFLIFSHDANIIAGLKNLFEADCAKLTTLSLTGTTERLIIGPDKSRQRLTQMLSNASSSILASWIIASPTLRSLHCSRTRSGKTSRYRLLEMAASSTA